MIEQQEPSRQERPGRRRHRRSRLVPALAVAALLAGCGAPAEQPSRVSTAGASDAYPNLADVPSTPPAHSTQAQRAETMEALVEDRSEATYTEPQALETAAPRDPFSSTLVISGDSVTTRDRFAGVPPYETAAGPGQLAAIVFFGHGSAELDAGDLSVLSDVATLQRQRGGSLRVVGHASSRTHNSTLEEHRLANFEMSLTRAETVLEELLRLGVPADAAHAEAVGDAEPVYHEFMPSGEAGNRRVEIFLEN